MGPEEVKKRLTPVERLEKQLAEAKAKLGTSLQSKWNKATDEHSAALQQAERAAARVAKAQAALDEIKEEADANGVELVMLDTPAPAAVVALAAAEDEDDED